MKKFLVYSVCSILALLLLQFGAFAAQIVLKSGVTITGKLINRTDEEITILDPQTNQVRVIKSVFIRDLVLGADEQKITEKKTAQPGPGVVVAPGNLLYTLQPEVGLMPGIILPVGKMADRIKLGGGFFVFGDVGIPKMPDIVKLRLGLSFGFYYHTTSGTDYASSLMHLPLDAYAKLQFIAPYGLKPYIKLGGGITPVLAGGATDMAPGFIGAVGLGYTHDKIPYMEFFFEAGFRMVFESIRGDYIAINVGAAYRFGAATVVSK
ncbi:MAG: hypothetical protein QUS66_01750 [Bacteroidota bacterium]|nr:hypothetical protein [Bacteroidota bacterium]